MTDLTHTELARLSADGEVRVVRKMEPQPDFGEYESTSDKQKHFVLNQTAYVRMNSPFPPAGTPEVIDGIACVWGESGCKQFEQVVDTQFVKVFNKCASLGVPFGISRIQRECCLGYVKASRNLEAMLNHGLAQPSGEGVGKYMTTATPIDAGLYVWVGHIRKDTL